MKITVNYKNANDPHTIALDMPAPPRIGDHLMTAVDGDTVFVVEDVIWYVGSGCPQAKEMGEQDPEVAIWIRPRDA